MNKKNKKAFRSILNLKEMDKTIDYLIYLRRKYHDLGNKDRKAFWNSIINKERREYLIDCDELFERFLKLELKKKKELLGLLHDFKIIAKVFPQDPLIAKTLPAMNIGVNWDPYMTKGPTSSRIAVVDYNADIDKLEKRVKWDETKWRFVGPNNEFIIENVKNPYFRQINVWAIIQSILDFFEDSTVMGRRIPWAFEGNRLIVVPNAGYAENAFYDRTSKSLQFYNCGSEDDPVFTSLSHDIIAHETGHAILDGIRPFYNELSSLQTTAFHEFIADLTSILSALNNKKMRKYVANKTDADLRKKNIIERIAEQFGNEIYKYGESARPYLRSVLEPLINIQNIKDDWSPHESSLVMTKAMWKVLSEFVLINHPPEDKKRSEAWKTQAVVDGYTAFKRLALRALDYCPPIDVQFIDYVHAMLKADGEAYPVDKNNYRDIIRDVFHKAGFCTKSNSSHGDCLLEPPETPKNYEFGDYDIERISESRTSAYHFLNLNREELHIPFTQDIAVVDLYATHKEVENKRKLRKEIIIEYIWREDVLLEGSCFGKLEGKNIQLLCGGTLVFDGRGNILYFVNKPGTKIKDDEQNKAGKERKSKLLKYIASLVKEGQIGLVDREKTLDSWVPTVLGHQVNGALRFEMTPHLRHSRVE